MSVEAKSDQIWDLLEADASVDQVATGFTFTEGPIWHPRDQYLLFSDMPADIRRKYSPDGSVVEMANPANKCNGMTYDANLNLIVCEHVTSRLVRESPDGRSETIASHFDGKELNSRRLVVSDSRRGRGHGSQNWNSPDDDEIDRRPRGRPELQATREYGPRHRGSRRADAPATNRGLE
jgi:sugar lactone lactonase YvrE